MKKFRFTVLFLEKNKKANKITSKSTKRLDKSTVLAYYYKKRSVKMNKSVNNLGNQEIFVRNLRKYLKLSNKSQNEVARAIGISKGSISDWTNGRTYPKMDTLQKLAEYFGINKSDLVEDKYEEEEPLTEEDKIVLDWFHRVPKEKREFVLSMIRAAASNL